MIYRLFCFFYLLFCTTFSLAAVDQKNLLSPERAFAIRAEALDPQHIEVFFTIAPGYYLYKDRIHFEAQGFSLTSPTLPTGKKKHDEFFGDVFIYRDALSVSLTLPAKIPASAVLIIRSQGCADVGVCYPPSIQRIELPALLRGEKAPAPTRNPFLSPASFNMHPFMFLTSSSTYTL